MGLISQAYEARTTLENPSTSLSNPAAWLYTALGKQQSNAGINVDADKALTSTTVFAAIRVLSETISSLPLFLYERMDNGGKRRASDHPLYDILHTQPNPEMSTMQWRETKVAHVGLRGNAFSEIERNNLNEPVALWPLTPDRVKMVRTEKGLFYRVRLPKGSNKQYSYIPARNILHIRGLSYDGLIGYSIVEHIAREAIGISLAAEEYAARWFANDATPGGVLIHQGTLGEEAQKRMIKQWERNHAPMARKHRIDILEEAMEYKQVGLSPQDSQMLESRKFHINDLARIWRIPPHMLGDLERATFSNIEQQSLEFVKYTLMPWLVRWEQEMDRKLLAGDARDTYYTEHLVEGLLRADSEARAKFYQSMFNIGVYSQNEIRIKENDNPFEGGDKRYVPLNMVPIEDVGATGSSNARAAKQYEQRSSRTLAMRQRLISAYSPAINSESARMVRLEVNEIRQAAEKFLKRRDLQEFNQWLEDFYFNTFPKKLRDAIHGIYQQYGEAVTEEVLTEIDGAWSDTDRDQFLSGYSDAYIKKHSRRSRTQMELLAASAIQHEEDAIQKIDTRLREWEEKRPEKIAREESNQLNNAVAREVYVANNFQVRWATIGESCPLCAPLDGRVVGGSEPFLTDGTTWEPDGAEPLTLARDVKHPQLHEGCDCMLQPDL